MSWQYVPLDSAPVEIIDGDRGNNYPGQYDLTSDGYCLFLNTSNVTKTGFKFDSCQFITQEKDSQLRKGKLQRNDVLLTTRGTIGNSAYYSNSISFDFMRINSGMVILRTNEEKYHAPFLYAYLRSDAFTKEVNARRSGAAQPQLPIRDLKLIKVPFPPLAEQKRVTAFISGYDDLIENNRRRIQLLEESARLLYKEWFVNLRFPGHEHVKIVDGVPKGWEQKALGDILVLNYGKALKADERVPGLYPVYGSSGVIGCHEKALAQGPAIILGRKGNVGSVFWSAKDFFPIDTVYFIDKDSSNLYIYFALQLMKFINTDVAVPGLNRDMAYSRKILIPKPSLLEAFLNEVDPMQRQIEKLNEFNTKLAEARDLLLPRLMNGELAV